jgi:chloramphenicol-sensitive protein RarD
MSSKISGKGFLYAVVSYLLWGTLPLYWKLLIAIDPLHILAFRIMLSLLLVGLILLARKNTAWLAVFRDPKKAGALGLTALLICFNWGIYIWAVNTGYTIEASLGYYINPLVSILLGLLFFREQLKPIQWVAVAIAFAGVLILTLFSGTLPWVSLGLALTFGFYSLLKKKVPLAALESLGAETLAGMPIGIALLCFSLGTNSGGSSHRGYTGFHGLAYLGDLPVHVWALLALCGAATMLPLYFFARGVKLLSLSTIGFTQFISPTMLFLIGLLLFGEAFPPRYFLCFAFIWIAVILYIVSLRPLKAV